MYRALAAVLFGLTLAVPSHAFAHDEIPYPADISYTAALGFSGASIGHNYPGLILNRYLTPDAACTDVAVALTASSTDQGGNYTSYTFRGPAGGGIFRGACTYDYIATPGPGSLGGPGTLVLDGSYMGVPDQGPYGWFRQLYCPRGGVVAVNDMTEPNPMCACPTGTYHFYVPAPPRHPGCKYEPHAAETCSVEDIPPFGPPDPVPLDMTNIAPRTRAAADCLLSAMGIVNLGGAGDAALFTSGYRTAEYQKHFTDLWDKRAELNGPKGANCAELKAKINNHIAIHELGDFAVRPPENPANCHTAGTCFDVRGAHIPAVDQNSLLCRVRRPLRIDDKWHVVPLP